MTITAGKSWTDRMCRACQIVTRHGTDDGCQQCGAVSLPLAPLEAGGDRPVIQMYAIPRDGRETGREHR